MKNDLNLDTRTLNWERGEREKFRAEQKAKKMLARAERDAKAAEDEADRAARIAARRAEPESQKPPVELEWVQKALKARGRTLNDLAKAWDVTPPTITKWIDGSVSMAALTLERAVALAEMLGTDLTGLAGKLGLNPPKIDESRPGARSLSPGEPVFAVERVGGGYRVRVDAVVTGSAGAALARAVLASMESEVSHNDI